MSNVFWLWLISKEGILRAKITFKFISLGDVSDSYFYDYKKGKAKYYLVQRKGRIFVLY